MLARSGRVFGHIPADPDRRAGGSLHGQPAWTLRVDGGSARCGGAPRRRVHSAVIDDRGSRRARRGAHAIVGRVAEGPELLVRWGSRRPTPSTARPSREVVERDDVLGQHPRRGRRATGVDERPEAGSRWPSAAPCAPSSTHGSCTSRSRWRSRCERGRRHEQAVPAGGVGLPGQLGRGRRRGPTFGVLMAKRMAHEPAHAGRARVDASSRRRRLRYRRRMAMRVGVFGAAGRMGATVCAAVTADPELELVAAVDPRHVRAAGVQVVTIAGPADALAERAPRSPSTSPTRGGPREPALVRRRTGCTPWSARPGFTADDYDELRRLFARAATAWSLRTSPSARC